METAASDSSSPNDAELSLADALRIATTLHNAGNLDDAEPLYRRIVETFPGNADALHFLGLLVRQRGRRGEAIDLMRRAVAADPGYASAHNNLGNLLCEEGELEAARASLARALELSPEDPGALNNLGMLERLLGSTERAFEMFQRAIALAPEFAIPYENLGRLYYRQGDIVHAHDNFCSAVIYDPTLCYSRQFMGMALCHLGRIEAARDYYRKWIEEDPANPVPQHLLSTVSVDAVPARASDHYVRTTFDTFASTFDRHLERLEYRAPALVVEALEQSGLARDPRLDILDAGCGTGLCGPLLRPFARRLDGVDLSPGMLARARETGRYDALHEAELTAFMRQHPGEYDIIVCADTLCYFGALENAVEAAATALKPGGVLAFTVEQAQSSEAPGGFCIRYSGRYAHDPEYVTSALRRSGFEVRLTQTRMLRMEAGAAVSGLIAAARRPMKNVRGGI